MSDQSPTAPHIASTDPVNGLGVKPRWWRRGLSPEEALYVLNEGHWAITGSHRVFRHLPSPPRCKMCFTPFGGVGGRVVRLAGFKPSRKNPSLCSHCCETITRGLGGAVVDTAVLVADIRGSTSVGEGSSPTEFAGLLNRFYKVATDTLVRHEESGRFESIRQQIAQLDFATDGDRIRQLAAAPPVVVGSVHAVTEDGCVRVASMTGSR